jgi:phage tail P2-like protein
VNLPDISIIKLLPPNLAKDKNVRMMCEAFDGELRRIIAGIPDVSIVPNLVLKKITDNLLLDLLAWQFHCDFYSPDLPVEKKQELILKSLDWHTRKGTPAVVEEIVSAVFSRAVVQEWFDYGGLPYHFRIGTEDELPDGAALETFYRAINSVKNTRSYLDKLTSIIYFEDNFYITDCFALAVMRKDFESFQSIKYNGAIKYDGHTVNETITARYCYNGRFRCDGGHSYVGTEQTDNPCRPKAPFRYSSGVADGFAIWHRDGAETDTAEMSDGAVIGLRTHRYHNGARTYNGAIKYDTGVLIPQEDFA